MNNEKAENYLNFLLYLNEKGLINNYDFDYEAEAEEFTRSEPKQPFPTFENFQKWWYSLGLEITPKRIYYYFKDKMTGCVEFPKVGERYEFSDDGKVYHVDVLMGFVTYRGISFDKIRPIQPDPKRNLIERLRAVKDDTGAVDDAIKALEEKCS